MDQIQNHMYHTLYCVCAWTQSPCLSWCPARTLREPRKCLAQILRSEGAPSRRRPSATPPSSLLHMTRPRPSAASVRPVSVSVLTVCSVLSCLFSRVSLSVLSLCLCLKHTWYGIALKGLICPSVCVCVSGLLGLFVDNISCV